MNGDLCSEEGRGEGLWVAMESWRVGERGIFGWGFGISISMYVCMYVCMYMCK